jgi:drug/metabolite transporter (DMT)-like permease
MSNQKSLRDYLLLFGIGIIWGGQFLFNAQAMNTFPPITIAAARVLIGALTLSIVTCFISEPSPAHARRTSLSGGVLLAAIALFEAVLPLFLIVWGQQRVDSSVAAVIVGSVPIITLALSIFMSKHNNFTIYSGLSVILGFIGIVVLVNPGASHGGSGNFLYEMGIFIGMVSFAISLNLMEKIPQHSPIRSTRNMLWIATAPLLLASLILDKPWSLNWNLAGVASLVVLGAIGSGIAYLMYTALIQRRGSVFTSLSNFIVPLVGVVLGVAIRGEQFGIKEGSALALVIAALLVSELKSFFKTRVGVV